MVEVGDQLTTRGIGRRATRLIEVNRLASLVADQTEAFLPMTGIALVPVEFSNPMVCADDTEVKEVVCISNFDFRIALKPQIQKTGLQINKTHFDQMQSYISAIYCMTKWKD